MQGRNLLIVGAAVLLGLVAVFLVNQYFSGFEQRQERIAEEQQLARIVVATQDMAFGSQLSSTNLRVASWPSNSVPAGAFNSIEQATAGGRVALRPITIGEPILASKVSGEGGRASLATLLPEDQRAVAVPINPVAGVGGFVRAGDVVDVMLTRQIPGDNADATDKMTTVILESVPVLAVDQVADENATDPAVGQTATLQTDLFGSQKIALATQIGQISLALRNVENQIIGARPVVLARDLGGGGIRVGPRDSGRVRTDTGSARPRASGTASPQVPQRRRGPTMTVVRGIENSTQEVSRHGFR